jgi:hypothetical protein
MEETAHYATVTEAINELRKKGFTRDFNLEENCIVCHPERFQLDEFQIVDVYRYEGPSDPADEAAVYAIESKSGMKGILVAGYGATTDNMTADILEKLKIRK